MILGFCQNYSDHFKEAKRMKKEEELAQKVDENSFLITAIAVVMLVCFVIVGFWLRGLSDDVLVLDACSYSPSLPVDTCRDLAYTNSSYGVVSNVSIVDWNTSTDILQAAYYTLYNVTAEKYAEPEMWCYREDGDINCFIDTYYEIYYDIAGVSNNGQNEYNYLFDWCEVFPDSTTQELHELHKV